MHKRILKYTLIIAIIIFVSASLFIKKYHNKPYIDKILTTKSYSYLPNEAKNYIKETYETTGQIILTEKNKKENTPYLNPDFISYLTLSEEEKESTEIIPETYIIDFSKDLIKNNQEKNYSSEYDISDLNDNNYTTQYYNQGNLEICWAFATVEQAESYLMIKNNAPYTSSTEKFSVRQLDYGTSTNGINNYLNENGYRELTSGGNYFMSSFLMSYGLSLVNESYMPFSETTEKKSLYNVLNYKNSNYELMQSKHMPILGDSYSEDEKNTYLNTIKDNIMAYGGAFVATGSPKGECGFKNTDGIELMIHVIEMQDMQCK